MLECRDKHFTSRQINFFLSSVFSFEKERRLTSKILAMLYLCVKYSFVRTEIENLTGQWPAILVRSLYIDLC